MSSHFASETQSESSLHSEEPVLGQMGVSGTLIGGGSEENKRFKSRAISNFSHYSDACMATCSVQMGREGNIAMRPQR